MTGPDIPLPHRLIVDIPTSSREEAEIWVRRLEGYVGFFRVGMDLFLAQGFPLVEWLARRELKVMLDLNLSAPADAMARAVRLLNGRGITFVTLHGSEEALTAALAARREVRLLTVIATDCLAPVGEAMPEVGDLLADLVRRRARRALVRGCDGLFFPGSDVAQARQGFPNAVFVAALNPAGVSARELILAGADHLVVGGQLQREDNPLARVGLLQQEISQALADRA